MKKRIKNFIYVLFLVIICFIIYKYRTNIAFLFITYIEKGTIVTTLNEKNEYTKTDEFSYVKQITDFDIQNKQDLLNAYYSIFNSGIDEFDFYCLYNGCKDDLKEIISNRTILSNIESFVHPFNGFNNIETKISSYGKVNVKVYKKYTKEDIDIINKEIDKIIEEKIKDKDDDKEKIKKIHDYIIKQTKYDSDRSDRNIINYKSHIAYGPLIEKKGICSGYSDAMALFLEKLNIKNYKVISENHIWNAVNIDNEWLHLDLTWDDPVVKTNEDVLEYNIFLITSKELEKINDPEHKFNKEVFKEL